MYSEKEITKLYKEAKHKKNQIKILAELNACDSSMIVAILLRNGYEQTTKFDYPTPIKEAKKDVKPVDIEKEKKRVSDIKSIRVAIEQHKNDEASGKLKVKKMPKEVADKKQVEVPISMLVSDEELYDMYVTKRQTIAHIAEKLNVDKHRLAKHLENHDIVRTRKENQSVSHTVVADAMIADKMLEAKINTFLEASRRLQEKADEFKAKAEALQQARTALSGNIGEDLGNVIKDIIQE